LEGIQWNMGALLLMVNGPGKRPSKALHGESSELSD